MAWDGLPSLQPEFLPPTNPLEKVIKKMATKCGHIDFIFPAPLYLGAGSSSGLPPQQVIYSFDFAAMFNIVVYP